jgi:acetyl esterase/lipase
MRDSAPTDTDREPVSFAGTDGSRIDAWLYPPDVRPTTGTTIVMAHGIGGIKSAGLAPIAERFAAAGHTCVVFDYRHFGASEGYPREFLSLNPWIGDLMPLRGRFGAIRRGGDVGGHG